MKQQTKGGALHRLWQALPWLWMAAAYLFDLWYQLVPGKWIVDSDLASEMILSDLLNKEGSIISHNWFYSTELKVVNLQWFYRLGLLLFPDDWHLARAFGMAVTLALYAACMLFFVKCARLGRPGLWMVGTLLWPFGQHYLVYAIYGGYYLVYTFFYMLVLALVLRSLDADKKHCALQWLAACIATAIAGMNGVKQLMVFHAPLCIAAAILLVLALHDSGTSDWKTALQHCRRQVRLFAASLVTAVAGAAGYFISNSVMSRLYDFKSYSFIVWDRDENWFTLDRILMDFFHEFGYQNGSGIFHFGGIAAGIGLLLGGWMFFCIVRLLLRLKKLETNDQLLVLLLVAMLAVCGISYAYFHEYYLYFWLMNMPVAIAVMAVELKTEDFRLPGARQLLGVDVPGQELRVGARENRTAKAISDIAHFTLEYARNNIGSKPGLARKHMFSSRVMPSSRAVITSLNRPHRYDELHAPWSVAVGMLTTHLENYLMRWDFTPQEMLELLSYTTTNWHPLIEHIFKTIFAQAPAKGLPVTYCRNPSLERASIQLLYLTLVKSDPRDPTYSFSLLDIVGCNA